LKFGPGRNEPQASLNMNLRMDTLITSPIKQKLTNVALPP
jgi:hypothetical protein